MESENIDKSITDLVATELQNQLKRKMLDDAIDIIHTHQTRKTFTVMVDKMTDEELVYISGYLLGNDKCSSIIEKYEQHHKVKG